MIGTRHRTALTTGDPADRWADARAAMVERQLRGRDIVDAAVCAAMRRVPRHRFVPAAAEGEAYGDHPVPIGYGQTVSQPYIVAFTAQLAGIGPMDRVLEVGTGCGYQAAVLAELGSEVCTVEIVAALARTAAQRLAELGYATVRVREGDGWAGWPERAPFDAIVGAAVAPEVPPAWREQVRIGGRIVVPLRHGVEQWLHRIERTPAGWRDDAVLPVRFVPMTRLADGR